MIRLLEFVENIILKLIDKINIFYILLLLLLIGAMNMEELLAILDSIKTINIK